MRAAEGGERMLSAEEVPLELEGVSVGKKRAAEESGERTLTAEEAALAARPLPPRELRRPKSGNHHDLLAWMRASDALHANDKIGDDDALPTLRRRKVSDTKSVAPSPASLDARDMILDVACSVVNVSATEPDGKVLHCTGIIIEYDEVGKCAKILSSSTIMCTKEGKLRHPDQKVSVQLSNDTVVEARVIFFNGHLGISLLDVHTAFPLPWLDSVLRKSFSSEEPLHVCELFYPSGGPVVNNSGEVIGLIVKHIPQAAIASISIVRKCIQMWNQFGHIAQPIHRLDLKTVRMLDVVYRDELWVHHNIRGGLIVDQVCPYSTAEKIGLRRGDVIGLIEMDHRSTLVELEEFLLDLCWDFLEKKLDSASTIDVKIRVHDIRAKTSACTILPMEVSDATVRSYY